MTPSNPTTPEERLRMFAHSHPNSVFDAENKNAALAVLDKLERVTKERDNYKTAFESECSNANQYRDERNNAQIAHRISIADNDILHSQLSTTEAERNNFKSMLNTAAARESLGLTGEKTSDAEIAKVHRAMDEAVANLQSSLTDMTRQRNEYKDRLGALNSIHAKLEQDHVNSKARCVKLEKDKTNLIELINNFLNEYDKIK